MSDPSWHTRHSVIWVAAALLWVALLCFRWSEHGQAQETPVLAQLELGPQPRDMGTAGVGDITITTPEQVASAALGTKGLSVDMPKEPLPGQLRPNSKGQCPDVMQIAINGGCWLEIVANIENCRAASDYYVYKGGCYEPKYGPQRQPTSTPQPPR